MAQAGTVLIAAWLLSLSGADSDYPIPTNINFQVWGGGETSPAARHTHTLFLSLSLALSFPTQPMFTTAYHVLRFPCSNVQLLPCRADLARMKMGLLVGQTAVPPVTYIAPTAGDGQVCVSCPGEDGKQTAPWSATHPPLIPLPPQVDAHRIPLLRRG